MKDEQMNNETPRAHRTIARPPAYTFPAECRMIAKRVFYSGRVQGVGFRYTARGIAAGFPVAGFVRNLENGDVELFAEGEADAVNNLLAAIDEQMAGNIRGRDVHEEPPGGLKGFEIRR